MRLRFTIVTMALALACGDGESASGNESGDTSAADTTMSTSSTTISSTTTSSATTSSATSGVDTGSETGDTATTAATGSTMDGTASGSSSTDDGSSSGPDPCLDPDLDDDGHDAVACGGDDCDDGDDAVFPGAIDGPWDLDLIDIASTVNSTDLVIDPDDALHLVYTRQNQPSQLRYATDAGGGWLVTIVDPGGVGDDFSGAAIALDAALAVHIAYIGPAGLSYATNAAGFWQTESVDCGDSADIAVDASGVVHIVHGCAAGLRHAEGSFGAWMLEDVVAQGAEPSVVADGDDLHVSYWADGNDLGYAQSVAGLWTSELVVDVGNVGNASSIAIDSLGFAHVSYCNDTDSTTDHATNAAGAWASEAVGSAVVGAAGAATDIALDGMDRTVVAWYAMGAMTGALLIGTDASGAWVVQEPAGDGHEGIDCSLALDSAGAPHAAYYNLTEGELRVAHAVPDAIDTNCDGLPW